MGNTASWGYDLCENALDPALCISEEPPPIVPEHEEVPVELYRLPSVQLPKRYMCKHFKRKRSCKYGSNCKFAHSKCELIIPENEFFKRKHVHLKPI